LSQTCCSCLQKWWQKCSSSSSTTRGGRTRTHGAHSSPSITHSSTLVSTGFSMKQCPKVPHPSRSCLWKRMSLPLSCPFS
jgi:hypothetical protein